MTFDEAANAKAADFAVTTYSQVEIGSFLLTATEEDWVVTQGDKILGRYNKLHKATEAVVERRVRESGASSPSDLLIAVQHSLNPDFPCHAFTIACAGLED